MPKVHLVAALVVAIVGCRRVGNTSEPSGCEREAEHGVIAELERADAAFDREQQLDCVAVRREMACGLEPAQAAADRAALDELRAELPGARASRAELVAMLVGKEPDPAIRHITAARLCVPIEREIATRQFLALHPERIPAGGS